MSCHRSWGLVMIVLSCFVEGLGTRRNKRKQEVTKEELLWKSVPQTYIRDSIGATA